MRTQSVAARGGRVALAVASCLLACLVGVAHATEGVEPAQPIALTPAAEAPTGRPLRHAKLADLRGEPASADVLHIAHWALDSGDHEGLPFVIVDKTAGRVFVFDADGRLRGSSAALVGSARGDTSVPGIGSRKLSSILPNERTTPAGRFKAAMGRGPKGEDILWIDYDGALALHRVVTGVHQERRLQRLESSVAADRRITFGCINVPVRFYDSTVAPTFGAGGMVYILPESRPAQALFGSYDVPAAAQAPSLR